MENQDISTSQEQNEQQKHTSENNISEKNTSKEDTTMGVVAYITVIGLIVAYVVNQEKKNTFVQYHVRQSLGVALTGLALAFINVIPALGWIISILGTFFILFLWVMGLINALGKKEKPVPVLGKKYEEWFKNV